MEAFLSVFNSRFSLRSGNVQRALIVCAVLMCAPFCRAQVTVSQTGGAAFDFPIPVPPGVGGMAPKIGLSYSSSGINGPVGQGWSVQGVSMITRCPSTKKTDGVTVPIEYGLNDRLCLDGQRLIQTSANGGLDPFQQNDSLGLSGAIREFRTERDSCARIRAYGAAGGNTANGPAYFKVWTKSGLVYEYGVNSSPASNAQIIVSGSNPALQNVVAVWPVSRVSDAVGNFMDFQYEQRDLQWASGVYRSFPTVGHEWNVVEIRYTGNDAELPANRVVFEYADRPAVAGDGFETYHKGAKNLSIRRLSKVVTYTNWHSGQREPVPGAAIAVKTFVLTYDNGPMTGRSRLKQIAECGSSTYRCLPPR